MTRLKLLETLSNNKVQDILEEMGMLENGNCPYTAEEIFKAGVEYAQDHIEPNEVFIDKTVDELIEVSLEKIVESVDKYFDYVGHFQDIHPYSKEEEQKLYDEMYWRLQDYNTIKYDPQDTWDLNFDDYEKYI